MPPAVAVAAVVGGLLVHYSRAPQPPGGLLPRGEQVAGQQPRVPETQLPGGAKIMRQHPTDRRQASGEAVLPQVVVVEDLESYSFIDLTTGVPIVSFATRDPCGATCVVVVPEPAL